MERLPLGNAAWATRAVSSGTGSGRWGCSDIPLLLRSRKLTTHELSAIYTPTAQDIQFATRATRTSQMRCNLLVLLKCFQRLGYLPALATIPEALISHVRSCLGVTLQQAPFGYETPRTLYRLS
jgi:hypothetical protein